MKKMIFSVLFVLAGFLLNAQNSYNVEKLDSLFNIMDANQKGMGSISVFSEGEEIYKRSVGYSNLESNTEAKETTKYGIASITKTFTAVIIMQLIEEGKLELSTPLSEFFPEVPNSEKMNIENLLRHKSGLFDVTRDKNFKAWRINRHSREEMLERIKAYSVLFEPGEKFEYSSTNYLLLSYIAEEIEGKNYAEILKDKITNRLSLQNTFYAEKIDPEDNQASNYLRVDSEWELTPETDMSVAVGAGGIISTPKDLNTFFYNLFKGNLVSRSSLEAMKKIENGYGIGLMKIPLNDLEGIGHAGGMDGAMMTIAVHIPEEEITAAYTSNAPVYPVNKLLEGALKILLGQEYELPDFSPVKKPEPGELDKYPGVYSSEGFPIDLTISKEGDLLMVQGTGQPAFPLDAAGNDIFTIDRLNLKLTFFPEEDKVVLEQRGHREELFRE